MYGSSKPGYLKAAHTQLCSTVSKASVFKVTSWRNSERTVHQRVDVPVLVSQHRLVHLPSAVPKVINEMVQVAKMVPCEPISFSSHHDTLFEHLFLFSFHVFHIFPSLPVRRISQSMVPLSTSQSSGGISPSNQVPKPTSYREWKELSLSRNKSGASHLCPIPFQGPTLLTTRRGHLEYMINNHFRGGTVNSVHCTVHEVPVACMATTSSVLSRFGCRVLLPHHNSSATSFHLTLLDISRSPVCNTSVLA